MADKYYCYFFTRQDLSPEQQIVQTGHAAMKLGVRMNENLSIEFPLGQKKYNDPDQTYFTVIGVRNLDVLYSVENILSKFGFQYEAFREPDIGNEMTSIAVYPIREDFRGILLAFNLLKVEN